MTNCTSPQGEDQDLDHRAEPYFRVLVFAWHVLRNEAPSTLRVYLALASRANKQGRCFPSATTIADDAVVSRTSVFRAIKRLVELNLVSRKSGAPDRTRNVYQIKVNPSCTSNARDTSNGDETSNTHDAQLVTPTTPKLDTRTRFIKDRAEKPQIDFDEWYKTYPRQVAKNNASKAYPKAVTAIAKSREITPPEAHAWLVAVTKRFADTDIARGDFCPHPATWLNAGRYDDDPGEWQKSSVPKDQASGRQPTTAELKGSYRP